MSDEIPHLCLWMNDFSHALSLLTAPPPPSARARLLGHVPTFNQSPIRCTMAGSIIGIIQSYMLKTQIPWQKRRSYLYKVMTSRCIRMVRFISAKSSPTPRGHWDDSLGCPHGEARLAELFRKTLVKNESRKPQLWPLLLIGVMMCINT